LYYVFTVFGIPVDLGRLIQMCWNETYGTIQKDIHWYISYSEWIARRNCLITIVFQLCFKICHYIGQSKPEWLKLSGKLMLLVNADYVWLVGNNICTMKKNTEASLIAN
jgi:hypothetical protein